LDIIEVGDSKFCFLFHADVDIKLYNRDCDSRPLALPEGGYEFKIKVFGKLPGRSATVFKEQAYEAFFRVAGGAGAFGIPGQPKQNPMLQILQVNG
jgi:hypothetical protein